MHDAISFLENALLVKFSILLMFNIKQETVITNFLRFLGWLDEWIELRCTKYEADAYSNNEQVLDVFSHIIAEVCLKMHYFCNKI